MVVHTIFELHIEQSNKKYVYKTKKFTGAKNIKTVEDVILKKCPGALRPFDIRIFDKDDGYVTLDQDYFEEYQPFSDEQVNVTTVQPPNSLEKKVKLQVFLKDHTLKSTIDSLELATWLTSEPTSMQNEQTERTGEGSLILEPTEKPVLLPTDPKMGFIEGCNVNYKQGDRYISDHVSVDTGKTTGKLNWLQGEKDSSNKYASVLPRFRIWNDNIRKGSNHVWTLLVYMVLDVCQSGKRSLFYDPQRIFVKDIDAREYSNPYEFSITTIDGTDDMEMELKLTAVVINGAKNHPSASLKLICKLQNTGENSSLDYCKSRLAIVLRKDTTILWKTLVLSNEMVFQRKGNMPKVTDILNNPAGATPKRKRSKTSQTTSNQRSRRSKSQRTEDHSSLTHPSTTNDNPSMLLNQDFLPNQTYSHIEANIFEPMADMLVVDNEIVLDSTSDEALGRDSISINNLFSNEFDLTNINENELFDIPYADI